MISLLYKTYLFFFYSKIFIFNNIELKYEDSFHFLYILYTPLKHFSIYKKYRKCRRIVKF